MSNDLTPESPNKGMLAEAIRKHRDHNNYCTIHALENIEEDLKTIGGIDCYRVFRKVRGLRQKLDGTFVDASKHPERDTPEDFWVGK